MSGIHHPSPVPRQPTRRAFWVKTQKKARNERKIFTGVKNRKKKNERLICLLKECGECRLLFAGRPLLLRRFLVRRRLLSATLLLWRG